MGTGDDKNLRVRYSNSAYELIETCGLSTSDLQRVGLNWQFICLSRPRESSFEVIRWLTQEGYRWNRYATDHQQDMLNAYDNRKSGAMSLGWVESLVTLLGGTMPDAPVAGSPFPSAPPVPTVSKRALAASAAKVTRYVDFVFAGDTHRATSPVFAQDGPAIDSEIDWALLSDVGSLNLAGCSVGYLDGRVYKWFGEREERKLFSYTPTERFLKLVSSDALDEEELTIIDFASPNVDANGLAGLHSLTISDSDFQFKLRESAPVGSSYHQVIEEEGIAILIDSKPLIPKYFLKIDTEEVDPCCYLIDMLIPDEKNRFAGVIDDTLNNRNSDGFFECYLTWAAPSSGATANDDELE